MILVIFDLLPFSFGTKSDVLGWFCLPLLDFMPIYDKLSKSSITTWKWDLM